MLKNKHLDCIFCYLHSQQEHDGPSPRDVNAVGEQTSASERSTRKYRSSREPTGQERPFPLT